jgi:hypothetical protein
LREDYGVPFWSNVNPEGIDEAQFFPDVESAQRMLKLKGFAFDECQLKRVDVYHTATAASIEDCIAAGIPRWDPSTVHVGAPADDSGTWGSLAPPSDYH